MKRIYLDHAATTPVDPSVARAMQPYYSRRFGNPGSLHSFGQEAIAAVDAARETAAKLLGTGFREIIFTGSATEANNLALRGAVGHFRKLRPGVRPRLVVSAVEHDSVLETAAHMEKEGVEIVRLPVNRKGSVSPADVRKALNARTAAVSVMYVNNEIGTREPVREIGAIVRAVREMRKGAAYPRFHIDAVQAYAYFPCDPHALHADFMTLSAHKLNGPKGAGLLFARAHEGALLEPIITGGGQEFGMRSGTENVAALAGFAAALARADARRSSEFRRLMRLKRLLWQGIRAAAPEAEIAGCGEEEFAEASPHILYIVFPGYPAEELVVRFDAAGLAVSSGSACAARAPKASHVVSALFSAAARGIRFSMGHTTTEGDIREAVRRIRGIFAR